MAGAGDYIKDIGNKVLDGASGTLPKAVLYIRDISSLEPGKMDTIEGTKQAVKDATALINDLMKDNGGDGILGSLKADAMMNKLGGAVTGGSNHGYFKVEVQYNPSSISLRTEAGKTVRPMGGELGGANGNQIVQVINPVATVMTMQIMLDDVNVSDAFGTSGVNLSAGGIASMVQAAKKGDGGYTVQPFVDGLLSLILLSETRQVVFFWNNMVFHGELTSVRARYTMFNKKGSPVRAVCDLTIRQGDEFETDELYWEKAFDNAFGEDATENVDVGLEDQSVLDQFLNLNL